MCCMMEFYISWKSVGRYEMKLTNIDGHQTYLAKRVRNIRAPVRTRATRDTRNVGFCVCRWCHRERANTRPSLLLPLAYRQKADHRWQHRDLPEGDPLSCKAFPNSGKAGGPGMVRNAAMNRRRLQITTAINATATHIKMIVLTAIARCSIVLFETNGVP